MCFDSSSSSASSTQNFDKRVAVDNGAFGLSGDSNTVSINTTSTDLGAVNKSVDAVNYATQRAADNAALAITGALDLSSQSITAIADNSRNSLAFADKLNTNAVDLAVRATGTIAASASDSLGFARSVVDMAFRSGEISQEGSSNAVNMVARAYDTATNYQAEKATTDSRYLVIAGIVAVAMMALRMGVAK